MCKKSFALNKSLKYCLLLQKLTFCAFILLVATESFAGNIDAPGAPNVSASGMFTLEDIYNRLNLGVTGTKRENQFTEPTSGPNSTMHDLNAIMNKTPEITGEGASSSEVLSGKKYWGLIKEEWGPRIGTMPNIGKQQIKPGTDPVNILKGYHDGSGVVEGDTNLLPANIKFGSSIYGVVGTYMSLDTSDANAVEASILKDMTAYVNGKKITGTIQTQTLASNSLNVPAGFYTQTTLDTVDSDLSAANIKSGAIIFGIEGDSNVVNTSSGDALASELMSGKKAWVDGTEITGTIHTEALASNSLNVPAGFYTQTTLDTVDSDLSAANIKSGATIFGIEGDSNVVNTSSGDALASELMSGKKAWVDGTEITGTIHTEALASNSLNVPAGFYTQTTLDTVDSDLSAANIKSGATIFGIEGDSNVVNTSSGDALASELMSGKKAWVDGTEITGTIHTEALASNSLNVPAGFYTQTTLDTVDSDLSAANIKSGATIFGIEGDSNVVNTSSGDALAAELMSGKKAWVDGAEITGTIHT
ncbi:MAG: hypothetical protein HQM10_18855, partial [Candidatus Riflebacteria bacterium]|nr:hypothetical protein [Candidatus Riflebacteria bacterium]